MITREQRDQLYMFEERYDFNIRVLSEDHMKYYLGIFNNLSDHHNFNEQKIKEFLYTKNTYYNEKPVNILIDGDLDRIRDLFWYLY